MQNAVGGQSIRFAGLAATVLAVTLVAGCLGPRVEFMRSGPGAHAEQKPAGCRIDFYRTKVDRTYVELAAIHASGGDTFKNGADAFHRALQEKACELGADAVIVTQDYLGPGGVMDGVAIKYGEPPPLHHEASRALAL
jgi:hypothetical protein